MNYGCCDCIDLHIVVLLTIFWACCDCYDCYDCYDGYDGCDCRGRCGIVGLLWLF